MSNQAEAWFETLPSRWKARRLKYLASCNDDVMRDSTPGDYEIEYLDISGVTGLGEIAETETLRFEDAPSRARRLVQNGDVLVSTVRTYLKAIASIEDAPKNLVVSTGFAVVRGGEECHPRYLSYAVRTEGFVGEVVARSVGVSYPAINASDLMNIPLPVPGVTEQTQIAAFLDHETAKIDALIARQQELIALLKEKRQAVISHAVTRGLNPDVKLRDSGVEWLGQVPEHWEVKQIRHLSPVRRGASPRPIDDQKYFDDGGEYAWTRIADVTASDTFLESSTQRLSELGSSLSVKLEPGELFLSIAGTVGKPCITGIKACIHDGFVYFPELRLANMFLFYIFAGGQAYAGLGKMGTQLNLNTDTVGAIKIPVPPSEEIDTIVTYLNEITAGINAAIERQNEFGDLLQERRSALISAAVTGKIDVRQWDRSAAGVAS